MYFIFAPCIAVVLVTTSREHQSSDFKIAFLLLQKGIKSKTKQNTPETSKELQQTLQTSE